MSGILEIAPAGVPDGSLHLPRGAKDRSIATSAARPRTARNVRERSFGSRMFSKAADLFSRLAQALRADVPIRDARHAEQDRAIAEQDSDIAAAASIARISAVTGAARAAVREEPAMSPIATQIIAAQGVTAATPRDDMSVRAMWRQTLPQLFSRLRRALHAPSVPMTDSADGVLEAAGAHPTQWSFAPQAREFAVSRRRQSGGGRARSQRMSRP